MGMALWVGEVRTEFLDVVELPWLMCHVVIHYGEVPLDRQNAELFVLELFIHKATVYECAWEFAHQVEIYFMDLEKVFSLRCPVWWAASEVWGVWPVVTINSVHV